MYLHKNNTVAETEPIIKFSDFVDDIMFAHNEHIQIQHKVNTATVPTVVFG